jgi:endonuclease/exonuclease/phosphatase (EEP) superfamily protein YafD
MHRIVGPALVLPLALCWILWIGHWTLDDAAGPVRAALHATTGWWGMLAPPVLALAAGLRWWRLAGVAAIPTAAWLASTVPGTTWARTPPAGAELTLVSANVLMINPEPDLLLAELFDGDPDLVVLQEYSPRFAAVAERYRVTHPHVLERPEEHSFGQAVFSRLPLEEPAETELGGVPMLEFTVRAGGRPVRVLVVHTLPPAFQENMDLWRDQLRWLAERVAADPGPLVVAGDLNATRHHPSFRRLLRGGGLRDGHAEVGRAAAWTWPNGLFRVPPLRLDHLLLKGEVYLRSLREGHGFGSDHRPLFARLIVR